MSRVIAFLACGFTLAACSSSLPSMDFFKSSPTTEAVRVESDPPGAEAKTTSGQSCRTPCELSVQPGSDQAVTLALNGYQSQTVALRADAGESGKVTPNPVYVELHAVPPVAAKKKKKVAAKKKPHPTATAAATAPTITASVPATAPAPAPASVPAAEPSPAPAPPPDAAYPWSAGR